MLNKLESTEQITELDNLISSSSIQAPDHRYLQPHELNKPSIFQSLKGKNRKLSHDPFSLKKFQLLETQKPKNGAIKSQFNSPENSKKKRVKILQFTGINTPESPKNKIFKFPSEENQPPTVKILESKEGLENGKQDEEPAKRKLSIYEVFLIQMKKAKQKNRFLNWQNKVYKNVAKHSDYLSNVKITLIIQTF